MKTLDELFRETFLEELSQLEEAELIEPEKKLDQNQEEPLGPMSELEKRIFTLVAKLEAEITSLRAESSEIASKCKGPWRPTDRENELGARIEKLDNKMTPLHRLLLTLVKERLPQVAEPGRFFGFRQGFVIASWLPN